ncbi:MAG: c-type cytochrome [Pseudomonadales bacterium]
MKSVVTAIALLAVLAAGAALVLMYSGAYNVGATEPHTGFGRWLLGTTMEHSVRTRAQSIIAPRLTADMADQGFGHYDTECKICHGAPGSDASHLGQGLRPTPPDLAVTVGRWEPAEIFWIIKHGIRMTGMPAWGLHYSDDELWSTVAFVRGLPDMTGEAYEQRALAMTWENTSSVVHTVTADPDLAVDAENVELPDGAETFHSGNVEPGASFTREFAVPGRYRYFCVPHESAGMVAELIVRER